MSNSDPTRFDLNSRFDSTDPRVRMIDAYTAHGGHHVRMPFITKVAENLYQGGVEDGLVLPDSFKHIVSLYPWEEYIVNHELLSRITVKMLDSVEQGFDQVELLAEWVNLSRNSGPVLVHCQAGLNRSSLVIAKALILNREVATAEAAVKMIRESRSPGCLCNPSFEKWVLDLD